MFKPTGYRKDDSYYVKSLDRTPAKKQFISLVLACQPTEEDTPSISGMKESLFMISIGLDCSEIMPELNTFHGQKNDTCQLFKTEKVSTPWS